MVSRRKRKRMRRKGKDPNENNGESNDNEPSKKEPEKEESSMLKTFYENHYKPLLIIPFLILIASLGVLGYSVMQTGDFIGKDVSLQGGLSITVLTEQDISASGLENELNSQFPQGDIRVRAITELGTQVGMTLDASDVDKDLLVEELRSRIDNFDESYSIETIGPALGASFFKQTAKAIWIAFVFMGMVVFLYFGESAKMKFLTSMTSVISAFVIWYASGTFMILLSVVLTALLIAMYVLYSIPSAAVVLAAFSDIVATMAIMNLMDINLSTAGIAALLMLIGYSVDTDILLSTRVLKRKEGNVMDRMVGAVKTGLTMNITTMAAIGVALIISQSETISQIMTILLIGLVIDVINTWIQNAGILKLYLEKKGIV